MGAWAGGHDAGPGGVALLEIADGQHYVCTAVGKHGGGVVADAGVGAGDHNDAPALIGDVCGRPFTGLVVVGGHGPNILTRIGGPRTRSNEGHDPVRGFLHSA
ncbi:Uncharacterised protein [Mycobacterium tuberculosis]|nr:Uncharacterised protein [Mycobacterium tuberculosis]